VLFAEPEHPPAGTMFKKADRDSTDDTENMKLDL
jgi:hypothetical protein